MSSNEPELLRKLLGADDASASSATSPSSGTPPGDMPPAGMPRRRADRPLIEVEPEDADLIPHGRMTIPPRDSAARGLWRFAPSHWPLPATTRRAQALNTALVVLAILGAIAGLFFTWYQLLTNPLADVHATFEAAVRLNAGQPLYPAGADPSAAGSYTAPPLLAIALRPVVLLGWPAFAAIWEAVVAGSLVLLLRRLGAGPWTWLALGILAVPAGWCLAIGQVQLPLTLLLAIGQPWSIALGANLGVFPALAALWWIGRREGQALGAFLGWVVLLVLGQAILEFRGSQDFLRTAGQLVLGRAASIDPHGVEPWIWAALLLLGAVAALALARTRWGWLAAVTLVSLASPRFVPWMLTGLLAAVREPDVAGAEEARVTPYRPVLYGGRR